MRRTKTEEKGTHDGDLSCRPSVVGETFRSELFPFGLEGLEEGEGTDCVDKSDGELLLLFVDL